jgi:hypothetical protein
MYVLSKVKSHSKFQISQTFKLFNSKKLKYSRTQTLKYSKTQTHWRFDRNFFSKRNLLALIAAASFFDEARGEKDIAESRFPAPKNI